jgi:hypothetical protein
MACPASFALPQLVEAPGEHANKGTAVHRFLYQATVLGRDQALAEVPEEFLPFCAAIPWANIKPGDESEFHAEQAMFWHTTEGVGLLDGKPGERDYTQAPEGAIVGTVDLLIVWDDMVYVRDYKTGHGPVPPAKYNEQLLFFAYVASRIWQRERAVVEIVRMGDGGQVTCDSEGLDADDLLRVGNRLQAMMFKLAVARDQVEAGDPDVAEGSWCTYCPAQDKCPAKTSLIRSFVQKGDGILEACDLRAAYTLIRKLERLAKRGLERVKELVGGEPLDLENGYVYGLASDGKFREFRK